MAKRARVDLDPYVRDTAIAETRPVYTIDLDQATVDELASGICSEALAQRMHDLLRWRRDAIRALARERTN